MKMKQFNIEDYLHKLDLELNKREKKEIYMIYIMIFAALFVLSYNFFWNTSLDGFKQKVQSIQDIKLKILQDESFLRRNPSSVLTKLNKQIEQTQEEFIAFQDYNQYIRTKIETIPFLLYDEAVWGEFINSIDTKAKQYNITLLELKNKINNSKTAFGHVMDINIQTKGNYKDFVKFVNALEESELVVDVHDINVSAKDFLEGDLNISVWGIRF